MDQIDEFRNRPIFTAGRSAVLRSFSLLVLVALGGQSSSLDIMVREIVVLETVVLEIALRRAVKLRLSQLLVDAAGGVCGIVFVAESPGFSMLLVLVAGPILWENFASLADEPGAWERLRNYTARISSFSDRMGAQEMQLRGHLWPVISVALAFAICLQGGWLGSRQLIHAEFDQKKVPVAAVTFLQKENVEEPPVTEPVFSTDSWGGYLIYRMYPEREVIVDDRHDLYGSDRIRQYLILTQAQPGWQSVLKKWQIRTALLPAGSTLSNLLRELRKIGG
jgi:hypothetical protein